VSWELPRIEVKPVIGNFDLVPVHNFLLEDTISVSQSISPGRDVERSHGVQETGSETTKTTITKSSIVLLLNDVLNAETKFGETLCESVNNSN
jgi:hypothetical protein